MTDSITWYVVAVLFVATLIRSTLGFGEALVAVPLLAMRVPLPVAAGLAVLVSTVMAAVIVAQDWRHVRVKSAVQLAGAALPGIPLGLLLLARGNEQLVKSLLGLLIVGFSLYSLKGKLTLHLREDDRRWLLGCGLLSGVLGGAYGMNGPPLVVYGALRRWPPRQFRATLQCYFLVASFVGLVGYAVLGLLSPRIPALFLRSLPFVLVGIFAGRALNGRLNERGFFRVVYAGLACVGMVLIVQANA